MKPIEEEDLPLVLQMAKEAKAAGKQWIFIDVIPKGRVDRYINLWEGCAGEIVGRKYWEDSDYNPDLPSPMTVKSVTLRVQAVDVVEAARRVAMKLESNLASPLRANKIQIEKTGVDTQR